MKPVNWTGALIVLAGFVLLQWHDNYTAAEIARNDAEAVRIIAEIVRENGIVCGETVVQTEAK